MGTIARAIGRPLDILNSRASSPKNTMTATAVMRSFRRVGKSNPQLYRNWSVNSELVRAAIDIRTGQLGQADWDIVRFDREGREPDKGLMRRMRELIESPNPGDASSRTFLTAIGEDILVLDAGCIEKERMLKGEIAYLWPTDGAMVYVDRYWDGNPKEPRYYYGPVKEQAKPLLNSDLVYVKIHDRSNMPIGVSYLEILKMVMESELYGTLYNARQVLNAVPDGIMDMGENARDTQVEAFRNRFEQEIAGKSAIGFWGGTKGAKWIPFRNQSNRDMQFAEWQLYQARKIAAVMQISIQDLQFTFDINRSSGEVQQELTEDRGVKPFLGKVQDHLTAEVCWDPAWGGRGNNIAFRFGAVSDRSSLQKAEEKKLTVAGVPIQSINQARMDMGWQPIGDPNDVNNPFNMLIANTPLGMVKLDKVASAYDVVMGKLKTGTESTALEPKQEGSVQ